MILGQQGRLELGLNWSISSITAPQDAHKLVLKVVEWLTASLVMMILILGQQGRLEFKLGCFTYQKFGEGRGVPTPTSILQ